MSGLLRPIDDSGGVYTFVDPTEGPERTKENVMSTYLFSYQAPKGYAPSADAAEAWSAWFEVLGEAVLDRGNPTFTSDSVGISRPETHLGGYSIIQTASLDRAIEFAEVCPIVGVGGGVEVGEITVVDS
jgi:hypothetical protein